MRNLAGSQVGPNGFDAADFATAGLADVSVARLGFAGTAGFATLAGFGAAAGFACVARFGGRACLEEPLKRSDRKPASLASIGSNSSAAIATMMVRRRGQIPRPASFRADDSNR